MTRNALILMPAKALEGVLLLVMSAPFTCEMMSPRCMPAASAGEPG